VDEVPGKQRNRGSKNFKSRLTEEDVMIIFKSTLSQSELARTYRVSQTTINHIKRGRTWAWLTGVNNDND